MYLHYKYEVLSNVYKDDVLEQVIDLRAQSYAMLIGNTTEIMEIVKEKEWSV